MDSEEASCSSTASLTGALTPISGPGIMRESGTSGPAPSAIYHVQHSDGLEIGSSRSWLCRIPRSIQPSTRFFLRFIRTFTGPTRFVFRMLVFESEWLVPLRKERRIDSRLRPTQYTDYTFRSFAKKLAAADLLIAHQELRWSEICVEASPID